MDTEEVKTKYEDGDLMVLSKPAFWVTTNEGRPGVGGRRSVEDWLGNYSQSDLPRRGIVNRLDLGTSGLLLVAKRLEVLVKLRQEQKKREIVKRYWALVEGALPVEGEIWMPIGRSRFNRRKMAVKEDGREAKTRFRRLKLYNKDMKSYSLLEVSLLTGRTHQIRVHFSYLRWPVAGDGLYGSSDDLAVGRQFLHSKVLKLSHPVTGEWLEVTDDLPGDLEMVLKRL